MLRNLFKGFSTHHVIGLVALIIGVGIGRYLLGNVYKQWEKDAQQKSSIIIKEAELNAETIKKQKQLESKEKYFKLKSDFDEEMSAAFVCFVCIVLRCWAIAPPFLSNAVYF